MKNREIIFFIKIKSIIGCSDNFVHSCFCILFTVLSVFELKIQIEFQMALE
jgi:hypothetical protein